MSEFDRLHPAVQYHVVNSLGWSTLRPTQLQAIDPIKAGRHCLLLAPTAGGKTEAAIIPVLSRMTTEQWRGLSTSMRTDFVLDALEQALYARQPGQDGPLVCHRDRGSQYVSIRYTQRLAEAGIEPSVGSKGDSYDNALAETINRLYRAELIHRRAPWKTREAVELATLEWVSWFNNHRLMAPLGYVPPAEFEAAYYRNLEQQASPA